MSGGGPETGVDSERSSILLERPLTFPAADVIRPQPKRQANSLASDLSFPLLLGVDVTAVSRIDIRPRVNPLWFATKSSVHRLPFADSTTIVAGSQAGQQEDFLGSATPESSRYGIDYGAGDVPIFSQISYTAIVTIPSFLEGQSGGQVFSRDGASRVRVPHDEGSHTS